MPMLFYFIGYAIGGSAMWAMAAMFVGMLLFGTQSGSQTGPRLSDLKVQSSAFGSPLALTWGSVRLCCNIIWSPGLKEITKTTKQGGGILGGGMTITTYQYFFNGAFALCDCRIGEITTVRRVWANGLLIYDARNVDATNPDATAALFTGGWSMSIYTGSATQEPDPFIEAHRFGYDTPGAAPAYRLTAYVVIKNFNLEQYGWRVPTFEFEIIRGTANPESYEFLASPAEMSGGLMTSGNYTVDFNRDTLWTNDGGYVYGVDALTFKVKYKVPMTYGAHLCDSTALLTGTYYITDPMQFGTTPDLRQGGTCTESIYNNTFWYPSIPTAMNGRYYVVPNGGISCGFELSRPIGGGEWETLDYLFYDENGDPGPQTVTYGYSTAGGQRAWRAMQEAAPLIGEKLTVGWRLYCGSDGLGGTGWTFLETSLGARMVESQLALSAGTVYAPAYAHDKTRDRLWQTYHTDADGVCHLRYLDLSAGNAYEPPQWVEITHPVLLDFFNSNGCTNVAYNADLDWVILVGKGTNFNTRLVAFSCDPMSLTGPEPIYQMDKDWSIEHGFGTFPRGTNGLSTISKRNWVITPSYVGWSMMKIYMGVLYDDTKVPLWQIVQDLCLLSGLEESDIDVTELTDLVQGYAVAKPTTARAAIEPLMSAYFFDAVETGGE